MKKRIVILAMSVIVFLFFDSLPAQEEGKIRISQVLLETIHQAGIHEAVNRYRILKNTDSTSIDFRESELNDLGYQLLNANQFMEAIEIFKLNSEFFPNSSNCRDSMGEAYMLAGQKENAVEAYQKSYELNPWNMKAQHLSYNLKRYQKREFDIPMRDGVKLKTILYIPVDESRTYPFLMRRTPYGIAPYGEKEYKFWMGTYLGFAEKGYIFVYQDVRGKFMSEGEFIELSPFKPDKSATDVDESTDTYDTIEWLLKNVPNHNGKVGMYGFSYPAYYSLMGALSRHPALAAICPQASPADAFIGDDFHRNGAFYLLESVNLLRTHAVPRSKPTPNSAQSMLEYPSPDLYAFFLRTGPLKNWNDKYFKRRLTSWNDMMEHDFYDTFWKERNLLPHLKGIQTAVLNVGGWYDAEDLYGSLKIYKAIEEKNPGIVNHLIMGPWTHGGWTRKEGDRLGEIKINSSEASDHYQKNVELPFFETYLKGKGTIELPEALIFDTGRCMWDSLSYWPPQNVGEKSLYLGPGQSLEDAPRSLDQGDEYREFLSDPGKPVPYSHKIENSWTSDFMVSDQRFAARRPDVLCYETQSLNENQTIAGEIQVELFVSTTGTDSDWFVKVIDGYPENAPDYEGISDKTHMGEYQSLVRLGVMRGKFRNNFEKPEPFVPGNVTRVKFKLNDVYHTFKKGHKLMMQIQSSCFPLFDINPQRFVNIYKADEKDFQKATHKVYMGKEYPSRITFFEEKERGIFDSAVGNW